MAPLFIEVCMSIKIKATQKPWTCEHCGKTGKNRANYKRDHSDRCPVFLKNNLFNAKMSSGILGLIVGSSLTAIILIAQGALL